MDGEVMQKPTDIPAAEPNWLALLAVARELERWLGALPAFSVSSLQGAGERQGTWAEFSEQQRRSEAELEARLRRLPGCRLSKTPHGLQTLLRLAGVEVKVYGSTLTACREWVALVQAEARRFAPLCRDRTNTTGPE